MSYKFTLVGKRELLKGIKDIQKQAPQEVQKMFFISTNETRNVAITSIQKNKSGGRVYKRGSVTHNASPPGGPPNTDTGTLVSNITIEKIEGGYDVGSRDGAPHGYFLEFKEPSRGGRKWLEPAWLMGIEKLKALVEAFR